MSLLPLSIINTTTNCTVNCIFAHSVATLQVMSNMDMEHEASDVRSSMTVIHHSSNTVVAAAAKLPKSLSRFTDLLPKH